MPHCGGTGIFIHSKLDFDTVSIENLISLKATAVKIKTDGRYVLYIVLTYLNPRSQFSAVDFNKVFGLPTADDKIIVDGDLNAKHQFWYSGLNSNSTGNPLFKPTFLLPRKMPLVHPISKPEKLPSNPQFYRPISLLSCISKQYEKLIYIKLSKKVVERSITPAYQFTKIYQRCHWS